MRPAAWISLLGTFVFLVWVQPTLADKRVALMIGNGAYQNASQLPNPTRDANALAELFQLAGFDVVQSRRDLGNVEFKRALRELNLAAINADIAVVFFAGHGIEINGVNYLLPVDARLKRDFDVEDEAVTLDRVLRAIEPAKKLRLVVLDACRENPFVRTVQRTAAIRSVVNGLGKVEPTMSDTLIAYAARAGSYSDDGDGTNSPFTTALLKHLMEPGLDVRLALGRVRDEVVKDTNNQQEPFVYGSLGGTSISLVPAPSAPRAPPPEEVVAVNYERAERINTVAAWEAFLRTFGAGYYADLARERIRLLQEQGAAAAAKKADGEAAPKEAKRRREEMERTAAAAEATARRAEEQQRIASREEVKPTDHAARPNAEAAVNGAADREALTRSLQTALNRVGCYRGNIDGHWGAQGRTALAQFAKLTKLELAIDEPTVTVLEAVVARNGRVCPLECVEDKVEKDGKCVPRARATKNIMRTVEPHERKKPQRAERATSQSASTRGGSSSQKLRCGYGAYGGGNVGAGGGGWYGSSRTYSCN
jgi:uncharacterized caspase-like protein